MCEMYPLLFPVLEIKLGDLQMLIYQKLPTVMEKAMATHSSTLAWEIPRTKEPGGLLLTTGFGARK